MKKGFTLVELLVVIVILAIISLIATPIVLNVIEKSKKGAAESSAIIYIDALYNKIVESEIKGNKILLKNQKYNVTRGTTIDGTYYESINEYISIKGYKPTGYDDYIIIDDKYHIEEAILTINGYEIKIENDKVITIEKGKIIELTEITIEEKQTMERGASYTIKTTFEPINTSDQRIKYKSSDEKIIKVDEYGKVTAISNGKAKIEVIPLSNKGKKKEIEITVISPSEVTGLKLNKEQTVIGVGKEETLKATLEPIDATSNALTWTSDNNDIAVVKDGVITGISVGKTIIKATTQSGIVKKVEVEVKYAVTLNEEVYYTLDNELTINPDLTNKTNISCSNSTLSILESGIKVANIKSSLECVISDNLDETINKLNSDNWYILMVNDENNTNPISISSDKNITLDLNGHNITSNTNTIENTGNLTIIGNNENSYIKTTGDNTKVIINDGKTANLKILSGHFISTTDCDTWYCGTLFNTNGSTLTINSKETKIENGIYKSGVYVEQTFGIAVWVSSNSKAEINGGEYDVLENSTGKGVWQSLVCSACDELVINDATVNGKGTAIRGQLSGTIIVNDGFYQTEDNTFYFDPDFTGTITINGGIFESKTGYTIGNYGKGIINIKNGEFKSNNFSTIFSHSDDGVTGDVNICQGTIKSGSYDLFTYNTSGNINYSNKVVFTNGTNIPTTSGNNIIGNYTGNCQ